MEYDSVADQIMEMEKLRVKPGFCILGADHFMAFADRDGLSPVVESVDGNGKVFGLDVVIDSENPDRGPLVVPESSIRTWRAMDQARRLAARKGRKK